MYKKTMCLSSAVLLASSLIAGAAVASEVRLTNKTSCLCQAKGQAISCSQGGAESITVYVRKSDDCKFSEALGPNASIEAVYAQCGDTYPQPTIAVDSQQGGTTIERGSEITQQDMLGDSEGFVVSLDSGRGDGRTPLIVPATYPGLDCN